MTQCVRCRERLRIVDGEFVEQRVSVDTGQPLDQMQRLTGPEGHSERVETADLVSEVRTVDDERVAIPVPA